MWLAGCTELGCQACLCIVIRITSTTFGSNATMNHEKYSLHSYLCHSSFAKHWNLMGHCDDRRTMNPGANPATGHRLSNCLCMLIVQGDPSSWHALATSQTSAKILSPTMQRIHRHVHGCSLQLLRLTLEQQCFPQCWNIGHKTQKNQPLR